MARKKTPEYLKSQIKEYGNIIKTGTEVLKEKSDYKVISISPAIDIALGGGVREGCWVTLTGDPKSGKTTTAMQIATNCQKEGRPVIYLDAEGRLKDMNFQVNDFDPEIELSSLSVTLLPNKSYTTKEVKLAELNLY